MEIKDNRANNRMVLLLIAGIPVTMILGASWLWYFVVRGDLDLVGTLGTANRGELVQPPRQIDEADVREPNGLDFDYRNLEPKWTMVIPGEAGRCDTVCENTLYLTKQIHTAMGEEYNRLRRIYVSSTGPDDTLLTVQQLSDKRPAPAAFASFLAREHRGLKPLVLDAGGMNALFAEYRNDPARWYLVDPSGWIMMSYNTDNSYKDVIADLKFLLKNSGD
jgi:hypothetical protein